MVNFVLIFIDYYAISILKYKDLDLIYKVIVNTDISKSLDTLNIAIDTDRLLTISEAEYFLTAKLDIDFICIDDIVLVDSIDNCYNILKMIV